MRRGLFRLHRRDQLLHQPDIGVVDHLRIGMTVHRRQMHNHVTLFYEVPQGFFVGKELIPAWNPLYIRLSPQQVVEMGADKTGLPGDTDLKHDRVSPYLRG